MENSESLRSTANSGYNRGPWLPAQLQSPDTAFNIHNILSVLRKADFSSLGWKTIGRYHELGLDEESIERQCRQNPMECLEYTLNVLIRDGKNPTWEGLAEAVAECKDRGGGRNVASKILELSRSTRESSQSVTPVPLPREDPPNWQIQQVKIQTQQFEDRFCNLKECTLSSLDKHQVKVDQVFYFLSDLQLDDKDEHTVFLKENIPALFGAKNHHQLFGALNFYWSYLSYHLLDHLIKRLSLEEVKEEMENYKIDLQTFLMITPAKVFCLSQKRRNIHPPPGFQTMVGRFDWPVNITLWVVEEFRQEYASSYNLRECAMMLVKVGIGSFIVVWYIPESTVKQLRAEVNENLLSRFNVISLKIAGCVVYCNEYMKKKDLLPGPDGGGPDPDSGGSSTDTGGTAISLPAPLQSTSYRDGPYSNPVTATRSEFDRMPEFEFVKKPSEDLFCPVTKDVLLQPCQTTCCGQHLSEEAATRIHAVESACPLCKEKNWKTNTDLYFKRRVRELQVFCPQARNGCKWVGELGSLCHHVESCDFNITPFQVVPMHNLHWRTLKKAPENLQRGSVVVNDNVIYIASGYSDSSKDTVTVYSYTAGDDQLQKHSECPHIDTALAIMNGLLSALGGEFRGKATNKIVSWKGGKWQELVAPMNVARYGHTTVTIKQTVIVAGGEGTEAAVEFWDGNGWFTVPGLPHPLPNITSTVCDDSVYFMDSTSLGVNRTYSTTLKSFQIMTIDVVWVLQPSPPTGLGYTLSSFSGQVFVCGGLSRDFHYFITTVTKWTRVEQKMEAERYYPIVAVLPPPTNQILIVGGIYSPLSVELGCL